MEKTTKKDNVKEIAAYLQKNCTSESDAISGNELSRLFNCDKRELRNKVNYLRCHGHPVCSSMKGYWYTNNPDDIKATIELLSSWIKGMNKAIVSLKKIVDLHDGKEA